MFEVYDVNDQLYAMYDGKHSMCECLEIGEAEFVLKRSSYVEAGKTLVYTEVYCESQMKRTYQNGFNITVID